MERQVLLGHGSGGTMMKRMIDEVFLEAYGGDELRQGDDAAILSPFSTGKKLAFSTDSFVVTPHFFPGGDIGRLAVCGTVNDIATSGARPLYLSCGFILEEGFPVDDLKKICSSMAEAAAEAGVRVVTGDTKVVNRGHGDGVYINTAGIGIMHDAIRLSGANCRPGDKVIVSGSLGDHGIAIMSCRESLSFTAGVQSDAAPLNHMVFNTLLKTSLHNGRSGFSTSLSPRSIYDEFYNDDGFTNNSVRCFRDPTRGGLASTLNELAAQSGVNIQIDEQSIPVSPAVQGACDMLGYDVLQVANEGKMVCVVEPGQAETALMAMRETEHGANAAIIGEVTELQPGHEPKVFVRNAFGGRRILDMLVGEQLPRIC